MVQLSPYKTPEPKMVRTITQPAVGVCQVSVGPNGNVSLICNPVAFPVPVLVTTMVNVAVWPAVTVPPSGVFAIIRVGPVTVVVPDPVAEAVASTALSTNL